MSKPSLGNIINALFCSITTDLAPLEVGVEEKKIQQHREKEDKRLDLILQEGRTSLTLPIDEYQELYSDLQVRVSRYTKTSRVEEMLQEIDDACERRMQRAGILSKHFIGKTEGASLAVSAVVGLYDFLLYGPIAGTLLSVPQFLASGASAMDLTNDKKLVSAWKLASIALSAIPPLEFLYLYSRVAEPFLLEGALEYSLIPTLHFLAGIVLPAKIMSDAIQHNQELSKQKERIPPLRDLRKPLRNSMRRLGDILDAIDEVQSIEGAERLECAEAVRIFDQECITYLQGNSGMDRIRARREQIKRLCVPAPITADQSASEDRVETTTSRVERPDIMHEATYELIISVGIADKTARRIARTVPARDAENIATSLQTAVQEDSIALLQANPHLFFLRGEERKMYLETLHRLIRAVARTYGESIPELYRPSQNPTAYSTLEGMDYLERTLRGEGKVTVEHTYNEQARFSLEQEGYAPFPLLQAVLLKGFHLGTKRPNIGMAYVYFPKVRARTQKAPGITSQEMDHFDNLFGNLIRSGVVLEDKVYKGGGGKFPGCYSITPHLKDIQHTTLRQYVAFCLYEHPARISH